jgi:hypothetical protein
MSRKPLLTLAASALLGVVIAAPNAALAQFGLLRVLRLCSLVLLRDWALVPLVVLRPGLSLAFRLMALWPRHRATSPTVRLVSRVLPACMVSTAAARPIFAASRVAPRPTALTASLEIVTLPMAVATGTGPMRRLRLTSMADPMPPPTTAATTYPPTGDTAPEAFWSVVETD